MSGGKLYYFLIKKDRCIKKKLMVFSNSVGAAASTGPFVCPPLSAIKSISVYIDASVLWVAHRETKSTLKFLWNRWKRMRFATLCERSGNRGPQA